MTAMTQYLCDARQRELRDVRAGGGQGNVWALFVETLQVVKGGLLPVGPMNVTLGADLRQDINVR